MKSYIIKIVLEESNPLIWRRVIMPAGATYRRLHDIIQNVTNFQSGYPYSGYHLYEFQLLEDNRIVTDDENAYLDHQYYKKNKKYFEDRLKTMAPELLQFEVPYQERLKIEVRKPSGLKIDEYLEKHREIRYNYDFGNDWCFIISLEEIVEDYYFGFPMLLDGAEIAPPEDVGGLHGFYEFLEAYRNPQHCEHEDVQNWVEGVLFEAYDLDAINERLRGLDYKKTNWSEITHDNYRVIEDKYMNLRCQATNSIVTFTEE